MIMQLKKMSIIAASTLIALNANAAAPVAYDDWVVEGGVIYSGKKDDGWWGNSPGANPGGFVPPEAVQAGTPIYTPPAGAPVSGDFSCDHTTITCRVLVQDEGFIYEEITYTNPLNTNLKKQYLRMIVVDDTNTDVDSSTASFSSESFVPFGLANKTVDQGVAVKQVVRDVQDNFVDVAEIQKGFLRLDPDFYVTVPGAGGTTFGVATDVDESFTTKLSQTFNTGEIDSSFGYTNYTQFELGPVDRNPDQNTIIGQSTSLSQTVILGDNPTIADATNKKKQAFEYRQTSGYKGTDVPGGFGFDTLYHFNDPLTVASQAGNMDLNIFPGNGYDAPPLVTWSEADDVRVTWIAATELAQFEPDDPSNPMAVGFAYQQVVNKGTASTPLNVEGRERYLEFVEGAASWTADPVFPDPFDWDPNFGSEPVF